MPKYQQNNYAYIDGANLHRGIAGFGWTLDYAKNVLQVRKEKAPGADETAQGSFS